MKKRFLIALLLLTIFSTYNIKSENNFFKNLYIEKIIIEGNKSYKRGKYKKEIIFFVRDKYFFIEHYKYQK